MKVTLINHTGDALNLLLRTKNTRLANDSDPSAWTDEERMAHLKYMLSTIKSSWEFVDYVFEIEGVTRAFTHQLVRTRTGSYAQEAMRVVDASHAAVLRPADKMNEYGKDIWDEAVRVAMVSYTDLLGHGVARQDARGLLPTNVMTSIVAKFNLRTLHEMARLRLCTRTQGEYQDVFRAMRACVVAVHPWAADFIQVECATSGTCAFPNYGRDECPVWFPELDNQAVRDKAAARFWEGMRYEAAPEAKGGMAQ